jgi:hypothetical protein
MVEAANRNEKETQQFIADLANAGALGMRSVVGTIRCSASAVADVPLHAGDPGQRRVTVYWVLFVTKRTSASASSSALTKLRARMASAIDCAPRGTATEGLVASGSAPSCLSPSEIVIPGDSTADH